MLQVSAVGSHERPAWKEQIGLYRTIDDSVGFDVVIGAYGAWKA